MRGPESNHSLALNFFVAADEPSPCGYRKRGPGERRQFRHRWCGRYESKTGLRSRDGERPCVVAPSEIGKEKTL